METVNRLTARWWIRILFFFGISNALILPLLFYTKNLYNGINTDYFYSIITEALVLCILLGLSIIIEVSRKNGKWFTFGINPDKWALKDIGLGAGLNLIFVFIIFIFATIFSAYSDEYSLPKQDIFVNITIIIFIEAIIEELIFRGIIFQAVLDRYGITIAILLNSILFGLGHLANPSINFYAIINIILAGVLFSGMYIKTKSLWLPISFHFFWNWLSAIIGSPVSGIDFPISLTNIEWLELPAWLFGGSFGLEGGFFATILLLISGFISLKYSNSSPYLASLLFERSYNESLILNKLKIDNGN
ncbi:MAG: CPBP family intramembrane metalloprotease [Bacteroidetes bacterium]|nr:MAG: CPBP family intramembrane metalloprotease [Bacteroidota bacterium]